MLPPGIDSITVSGARILSRGRVHLRPSLRAIRVCLSRLVIETLKRAFRPAWNMRARAADGDQFCWAAATSLAFGLLRGTKLVGDHFRQRA